MEERKFYIYIHMKGTDDSVFYVGKGCGPRYKVKSTRSQYWKRIVAKHGFTAEIIQKNLTFDEANAAEIELIAKLRSQGVMLCNITDGGEGSKGWKKTPEQIEHHRKMTTGLKRSEESKAKMRNREWKQESLDRIGKAQKGKVVSEETRKKMSEGAKKRVRKPHSEETRKKITEGKIKGWAARERIPVSEETRRLLSEKLKAAWAAKKQATFLISAIQQKEDHAI